MLTMETCGGGGGAGAVGLRIAGATWKQVRSRSRRPGEGSDVDCGLCALLGLFVLLLGRARGATTLLRRSAPQLKPAKHGPLTGFNIHLRPKPAWSFVSPTSLPSPGERRAASQGDSQTCSIILRFACTYNW